MGRWLPTIDSAIGSGLRLLPILLLLATVARAEPIERAVDDAVVTRVDEDQAPLVDATPRGVDLAGGLRLRLPAAPARGGSFDEQFDLDRPFALRLPAPAPDGLRLDVSLGRVTAYVWADMSAELPRLDAVDGETYFTPGLEVSVAPGLRAFLEDFQPASGVIGGADPDEPAPARSWDGHQVAAGLRWEPLPGLTVELAAVGHVLSATRRPAAPGALASVTLRL